MRYTSTMTSKGQVTVPIELRRKYALLPGRTIRFNDTGKSVQLGQEEDWEAGLAKLHKKVAAHLKKQSIRPLTDEELDQVINESAAKAAIERYRRSLPKNPSGPK